MSKFKLFIENFFIYGFGGVISKIIPLIMVPIIARLMPSADYFGINDMTNAMISFAVYLSILGMYDAMYRLYFDKDDEHYKKTVCSTALAFNVCSSLIISIFIFFFRKQLAYFFLNNKNYAYIIIIVSFATFIGATNSIVSAPTRMQNKRKIFLLTNTISPILSYVVAIPMLIKGYYLIALPIAGVLSSLVIEVVFWIINKEWFNIALFDNIVLKELFRIGIPLLPNFLIYWIFNSCDKVMITKSIGIGAAGVYSIGAKLGMASQLIYTAFAGGWQFFSFYTMNDEKQVENNSRIFEYLGIISFIATFFICTLAEPLYVLLFENEYHVAFIVSPYLFLAPLVQMLYQVAGNQFLIIKKTWPCTLFLLIGAIANIILNFLLIPRIGIEGAAISTLIGYITAVLICVIVLNRMNLILLRKKFYIAVCIVGVYIATWRFVVLHNVILSLLLAVICTIGMIILYKNDIIKLLLIIKQRG